jgi:hypothetical protein
MALMSISGSDTVLSGEGLCCGSLLVSGCELSRGISLAEARPPGNCTEIQPVHNIKHTKRAATNEKNGNAFIVLFRLLKRNNRIYTTNIIFCAAGKYDYFKFIGAASGYLLTDSICCPSYFIREAAALKT